MFITSIKHIHNNHWLVIYYEPMKCMCGNERKSIEIESKYKPTEDEIKYKIERLRVELGDRSNREDS